MKRKSPMLRLLYRVRDWRSRALFTAMRRYARGHVLDVGGCDFFLTAQRKCMPFERWTTLENDRERAIEIRAPEFELVYGDGCDMDFDDQTFDTVLNVQVLEHVFEPIRMVEEIGRVLKRGGHAIFVVPTTSTMHLAPHYHYNFSRYWIREALERAGFEMVELVPMGGVWSSMASHLVFFFFQSTRYEGMSDPEIRRGPWFYLLFPFMAVFAIVCIPIALVLSLGDLAEEPNNHLVVGRRR
jgi:SAM-dependent methyltransferase